MNDATMNLEGAEGAGDPPPEGFAEAVALVFAEGKVSTSFVQRRMGIGYNRAARLVEAMEARGMVTVANHVGKREVIGTAADHGLQGIASLARLMGVADAEDAVPAPSRMRETDADRAVRERAYDVTADELRSFVERIEAQNLRIAEEADVRKEVFAEAKGRGYDTKALRKIVALRKRKPEDIAEEEAVLDLYKAAMGMA